MGFKLRAVHVACMEGNMAMVDLFLEFGANLGHLLAYERSPLHTAARYGKHLVAEKLLAAGANVNDAYVDSAEDEGHASKRKTPLLEALQSSDAEPNEKLRTVEVLLQNGADVTVRNPKGKRPLDIAMADGLKEVVEVLRLHMGMPDN
jgi:ankyrin repeat protein